MTIISNKRRIKMKNNMPEPEKNKNILLSSKKNNLYNNCTDCGRQIPQSQKLCVSCKAEKIKEEMRITEEVRKYNKRKKEIEKDLKKYNIKKNDS
jgi:hypothetical protein